MSDFVIASACMLMFGCGFVLSDSLAKNVVAKQNELISKLNKELQETKTCYAGCDIGLRRLQDRLDAKERSFHHLSKEFFATQNERDDLAQRLKTKEECFQAMMNCSFKIADLNRINLAKEDEGDDE